jgi:hypothetical protein
MERNWTETGAAVVYRVGGRAAVDAEIGRLDWELFPDGGTLMTGFMQGHAINACIQELNLPKVSGVATNGSFAIESSTETDGFYPGFYGIECNYRNGRVRVYVIDTGTGVVPVLTELTTPAEMAAAASDDRERDYWVARAAGAA